MGREEEKKERRAAGNGMGRAARTQSVTVRANLQKERNAVRRRNTFRVGHTETPQMPSFHNRLLPSAPFLLTRPNILLNFHKGLCLSPPSSPYNPTPLRRFALFPHHPALRGVFSSPFSLFPTLLALSRFFGHHASLPPVSHPPYKCFTLPYALPNTTVAVPPLPA